MINSIDLIREKAFSSLHLIFVKKNGNKYRLNLYEIGGFSPKLVDYIGFQFGTSLLKVKDIGSDAIYLLTPQMFRKTRIKEILRSNPDLEFKLKEWFPVFWGAGSEQDLILYASILRQLDEIASIR